MRPFVGTSVVSGHLAPQWHLWWGCANKLCGRLTEAIPVPDEWLARVMDR